MNKRKQSEGEGRTEGLHKRKYSVETQFDDVNYSRIERMAKRKHTSVQGSMQSYIRAATMERLSKDEAEEEKLKGEMISA